MDTLFSSPVRLFGVGIPCLLILLIIIILLVVLVALSRPRKEETQAPPRRVVTVEPEPAPTGTLGRTPTRGYSSPSRGYYRSTAGVPPYSETRRTYPSKPARRYEVSEAATRERIRRDLRSQTPSTFQPARQKYGTRERRLPSRPSSVTVKCQGCRNVFYIQDKTPPFKTKCPFCAKHNIVV